MLNIIKGATMAQLSMNPKVGGSTPGSRDSWLYVEMSLDKTLNYDG